MSRQGPPGLQYPRINTGNLDLDAALRNVFDNLFYLRRLADQPATLTPALRAEIQRLINSTINNIVNNITNNITVNGGCIVSTHNVRLTTYGSASDPIGTLFFEYDRNVLYVISTPYPKHWEFVAGVMVGLLAARPADLGSTDVGFLYFATDEPALYIWDGSAWVQVTSDVDVEAVGYWSPITNGNPTDPELIFDSDGDIVVGWTFTP